MNKEGRVFACQIILQTDVGIGMVVSNETETKVWNYMKIKELSSIPTTFH